MVKKTLFIAFFLCGLTLTGFLMAGEFTASVSSTQVQLNENFSLNLILKDTNPKEAPSISALKDHFIIHSQQHLTNTTILNGKVSSNITWRLSLTPIKEGVAQIPSLTVDTAEGLLTTQPITLNVVKNSDSQSNTEGTGLNIITKVSNASPYKNEPFIYTALLTSKAPLYNIQTQKIEVKDAIVELVEQPKLEKKILGGVLLHVIELTYLITPLKAGPLTISPIAIQGATPQKSKGSSSSFFNDDFGPFGAMSNFERLKPFYLTTEEIQFDVQPIVSEVSPWLTARDITLEEQWPNDQLLRVGEPISRSFLIKAEGIKASQLPHLKDLEGDSALFKIYADKPEEQDKISDGVIQAIRKEQHTLIPQQAGTWTLPEISINWWDSAKREKKASTLPARTVHILPASATTASSSQATVSTPTIATAAEAPNSATSLPIILYGIIAMLTLFLTATLIWIFLLQRKMTSLAKGSYPKAMKMPATQPKKPLTVAIFQKEKKGKLPELNPT